MKAINVTKNSFDNEVINSQQKVLLDFWAPWCGPCKMVGPILDEIAAERPDVKVCKVNVDEEMELARQFRVLSIPTMMVMQEGRIEHKMVGARGKAQILAAL
jgi:thioredoxin 1